MSEIVRTENLNPNIVEGFDIGNAFVNFDEVKFATKTKVGKLLNVGNKREEIHQVTYNGVDYIVGDGKSVMGENKYNTDSYKLCLLTAIALRSGRKRTVRAKICLGLPILNFERKSEEVKEIIESWGTQVIEVNEKVYKIDIVDVDFFIEGGLAVLEGDTSNMIGIDIGGGTVNVIEWDGMSPVKYETLDASITNVYSNIAQYLNLTHGGSFTTGDVEKLIINNKKTAFIKQKEIDISEVYLMVKEFVDGVVSSMEESKFRVNQVEKIKVFGGGAYTTHNYFKEHFPEVILVEDAQFVNSKVLRMMAKM